MFPDKQETTQCDKVIIKNYPEAEYKDLIRKILF
jgi:hypothetical protein